MGLKNKTRVGGQLLMTAKIYKLQNVLCIFEDWLSNEYGIEKQTFYNYRNLLTLMSLVPKLGNYKVNVTYFYKKHEIFNKYFVDKAQK